MNPMKYFCWTWSFSCQISLSLHFQGTCGDWAHLCKPGFSPHAKILNLISAAKPLCLERPPSLGSGTRQVCQVEKAPRCPPSPGPGALQSQKQAWVAKPHLPTPSRGLALGTCRYLTCVYMPQTNPLALPPAGQSAPLLPSSLCTRLPALA